MKIGIAVRWVITVIVLAPIVWVADQYLTSFSNNRYTYSMHAPQVILESAYGFSFSLFTNPEGLRAPILSCFTRTSQEFLTFPSTGIFDFDSVCTNGTTALDLGEGVPACNPIVSVNNYRHDFPLFPSIFTSLTYLAGTRGKTSELYEHLVLSQEWTDEELQKQLDEEIASNIKRSTFFNPRHQSINLYQCDEFALIEIETVLP